MKDDITDGPDDKQIDAIVIDDDKSTVFIIQGKFIGNSKVDAAPLREVLSSWIQLKDLVRLQEVANGKLKRKLSEVAKALEDEYEITFELITTSSLTAAAQEDLATFQETLAKFSEKDDFISSIHLVDRDELKRRYDIALDIENPIIHLNIGLEDGKYLTMNIAGTYAIIAAIPLRACINFPGIKDGTLFRKNVRQSLGLNKVFEQKYSQGHFITKRGEIPPANKDKKYILDLSDLGKYLISWHSQRPNIAYSEAKIFDKYFEQLFKREYKPEDAQALNFWIQEVQFCWSSENPFGIRTLLV